jgi:hypothetical protein
MDLRAGGEPRLSHGYAPEGIILGWGKQRRLLGERLVGCSDCPKRPPVREMVEVTEEHESLTWFPGHLLHYERARGHGILQAAWVGKPWLMRSFGPVLPLLLREFRPSSARP